MSKVFKIRISNETVLSAIAEHALAQGIAESTAIGRMLAEGLATAQGKPITRFAVIDPENREWFSLALGEIRPLREVLKHCVASLATSRPIQKDELETWQRDRELARAAFANVSVKLEELRRAGKMEFVFHGLTPKSLEHLYQQACEKNIVQFIVLYGALLGFSSPKNPLSRPPVPAASAPMSPAGTQPVTHNGQPPSIGGTSS